MNILVKFLIFDLPPGFADAELELVEGSVVRDLMDACLELFGKRQVSMDKNEFLTATVMVNGKWCDMESPLSDGDMVNIIRPMDGG